MEKVGRRDGEGGEKRNKEDRGWMGTRRKGGERKKGEEG